MATEKSAMPAEKAASEKSASEKAAAEHLDRQGSLLVEEAESDKNLPAIRKVDYSGAYEKTDPKEIALVKKLDRWIMVCPLTVSEQAICYFLGGGWGGQARRQADGITLAAHALEYVLAQLSRQERHCPGSPE